MQVYNRERKMATSKSHTCAKEQLSMRLTVEGTGCIKAHITHKL